MHYKNGQEAKLGDLIVVVKDAPAKESSSNNCELVGILASVTVGAPSCNGTMKLLAMRWRTPVGDGPWLPANVENQWSVTLSECLPVV